MPITTSKTELFTSGPISFSSLQSSLGGSPSNVKFSTYLRNDDLNELNPVVPDATENESIPPISDPKNLGISSFRGVIKQYVINQSGLDENLDLNEDRIIDNDVCAIVGYTGPWNGNLGKNIPKKVSIGGTCYASTVGKFGASINGFISNLEVEVSETGAIYGAGGEGGNQGSAPQTSIRTASMEHFFNNTSDQTLSNVSTGGITVQVVNPGGPDGLILNGDVTSSTALNRAKHYRVIFSNPYLDTNYSILVTNVSNLTAGGASGGCVIEGIGDKTTEGFRVWFRRSNLRNTYVRSFFVETEGNSSAQLTPITFNLTSTSFINGDVIGTPFLLQASGGQNRTPQLSWSLTGLPSGVSVSSYQIYLEDLSTADSFRHWHLENIASSVSSISEGQTTLPLGATNRGTDYGPGIANGAGYGGPTLVPGERHHYRLTVRAILSGSPSTPTASLEFYAGGTSVADIIPDLNPPTNRDIFDVVTGAGVNELGSNGGPGGDGGGALYVNNVRSSTAESTRVRVKLNPNAKIWSGGGGGSGGGPGKNGPVITCNSTTTFFNFPSSTNGQRNCPGNANCPSGSRDVGCSPAAGDVRTDCRGSSPRRGESGYVCAANWVRACQFTSSNLTQGLGGSGGAGGVGRGFANINSSLAGIPGSSPTTDSCSGSTSAGQVGTPGSSGGDWGENGGGRIGGKKGPAIIGRKFVVTGSTTNNFKGGTAESEQIGGVSDELVCTVPDPVPVPDPGPGPITTEITDTYTTPGIQSWIVPVGVSSISITAIGGGAGGGGGQSSRFSSTGDSGGGGGGGGGLGYTINTVVTPGQTIWIQVGAGGVGGAHRGRGTEGGDSLVRLTSSTGTLLCAGYGGKSGTNYRTGGAGGSFVGDGGGAGGNGANGSASRERGGGGGGAGGFTGAGGDGVLPGDTSRLPGPGGTYGGFGGTDSSSGELGGGGGEGISLNGTTVVSASSQVVRNGGSGAAFGGGGGGATLDTAPRTPTNRGGNGGTGAVKITYLQTI